MNINGYIHRAVQNLDAQMMAAERIPAPGAEPQFVYDDDTNSFSLTITTIPRDQCPHTTQSSINVMATDGSGTISLVTYCVLCNVIMP